MAMRAVKITAALLLALGCTTASPVRRGAYQDTYLDDLDPVTAKRFGEMIKGEVDGHAVENGDLVNERAKFKQAMIQAPVESVIVPNPMDILDQPLAQAAIEVLKRNAVGGNLDMTEADIGTVYADAIDAASQATGVTAEALCTIIWRESKGHPLYSNGGLMQIDDLQWGAQKDQHPELTNRYNVADNIMAGAMALVGKCGGPPPSPDQWVSVCWPKYRGKLYS